MRTFSSRRTSASRNLLRMFTGLVREVGKVTSFEDGRLVVESATAAEIGDSIAIDVCLTVVQRSPGRSRSTSCPRRSSRSQVASATASTSTGTPGGRPARRPPVQGHVDGTGTVTSVETVRTACACGSKRRPSCSLLRRKGVDHGRRRLAHRRRGRREGLRSGADPAHARGHNARRAHLGRRRSTWRLTCSPDMSKELLPVRCGRDDGSRARHREPLRNRGGGDRGDSRRPLRRRRRDEDRETGDLTIAAQFATPERSTSSSRTPAVSSVSA